MKRPQIAIGVAIFALALVVIARSVLAAESSGVDLSTNPFEEPFSQDVHVALRVPLQSSENLSFGAVTASSDGEESASELNRKLTNPVSSIWSISNQFNNFELNNGQWNNNWLFQPVLPVSLTKNWNLITRPVMPFYNIVPHETAPGSVRAGRRAGRSGCGGVAVACAVGKLGSRSGPNGNLPDCDLTLHGTRQVAARTQCGGRLPH